MVKPGGSADSHTLVVIAGPTAVGKTAVAIHVARALNTSIISADSRQFYREMEIGTAVPSKEQLSQATHYLIGNLSVHDVYNVSRFEQDVLTLLPDLFSQNPVVVMVGGSGLYIQAACHGIGDLPDADPELRDSLHTRLSQEGLAPLRAMLQKLDPDYAAGVDPANPNRIIRALEVCLTTGRTYTSFRNHLPVQRSFRIVKVGLDLPRALLHQQINARVDQMMAEGLEDEARRLYPLRHLNALNTVGYRELFGYFEGHSSLPEAVEKIKTNTRRYARRQLTWFRKDKDFTWLPPESDTVMQWLNQKMLGSDG
jgi:tRNA dimethylallyltransferase